ncbi:hypothetical protein RJT34_30834 [Clitoria ternatea]|uniref:Uncharacterized protein n=1 Tax=Clitoria ternatea TaxID=43366 RepID=A0AAN9ETJ4_CLITE
MIRLDDPPTPITAPQPVSSSTSESAINNSSSSHESLLSTSDGETTPTAFLRLLLVKPHRLYLANRATQLYLSDGRAFSITLLCMYSIHSLTKWTLKKRSGREKKEREREQPCSDSWILLTCQSQTRISDFRCISFITSSDSFPFLLSASTCITLFVSLSLLQYLFPGKANQQQQFTPLWCLTSKKGLSGNVATSKDKGKGVVIGV